MDVKRLLAKPSEELFKHAPSLYLSICWSIRFKNKIVNKCSKHGDFQEKRYLADMVLVHSKNANIVYDVYMIEKVRHIEKKKKMREHGGILTESERYEYALPYYKAIDKICDKLLSINANLYTINNHTNEQQQRSQRSKKEIGLSR